VAGGGSAGSVTLILQALLTPLALAGADSRLILCGGTHVPWSPPCEYLERVFRPMVARCGLRFALQLQTWGFYPAGGGRLEARVQPAARRGVGGALVPAELLWRGRLRRLRGWALTSRLPHHVARRMVEAVHHRLAPVVAREPGRPGLRVEERRVASNGPGAVVVLVAEYEEASAGFTAWGKRGKPAEVVADEASTAFLDHHRTEAPVDPRLGDQLLVPLALAAGRSRFTTSRITRHLVTNAQIIAEMVPARIVVAGEEDGPGEVTVEGAGGGLGRDPGAS
jgi:RNA 3'-terminal phosphate cyclase (ATP)